MSAARRRASPREIEQRRALAVAMVNAAPLGVSIHDVAQRLGTSRDAATNMLRECRKRGLISAAGGAQHHRWCAPGREAEVAAYADRLKSERIANYVRPTPRKVRPCGERTEREIDEFLARPFVQRWVGVGEWRVEAMPARSSVFDWRPAA